MHSNDAAGKFYGLSCSVSMEKCANFLFHEKILPGSFTLKQYLAKVTKKVLQMWINFSIHLEYLSHVKLAFFKLFNEACMSGLPMTT